LGHRVSKKPTHTSLYLNARSHKHLVNKQAALSTLVHRAKPICNPNSLKQELQLLQDTVLSSGCSKQQILQALNPPKRILPPCRKDPTAVVFMPFVSTTFSHISKVLSKHFIKMVGFPPGKLFRFLWPINDNLA
jgi:hypothetical protein